MINSIQKLVLLVLTSSLWTTVLAGGFDLKCYLPWSKKRLKERKTITPKIVNQSNHAPSFSAKIDPDLMEKIEMTLLHLDDIFPNYRLKEIFDKGEKTIRSERNASNSAEFHKVTFRGKSKDGSVSSVIKIDLFRTGEVAEINVETRKWRNNEILSESLLIITKKEEEKSTNTPFNVYQQTIERTSPFDVFVTFGKIKNGMRSGQWNEYVYPNNEESVSSLAGFKPIETHERSAKSYSQYLYSLDKRYFGLPVERVTFYPVEDQSSKRILGLKKTSMNLIYKDSKRVAGTQSPGAWATDIKELLGLGESQTENLFRFLQENNIYNSEQDTFFEELNIVDMSITFRDRTLGKGTFARTKEIHPFIRLFKMDPHSLKRVREVATFNPIFSDTSSGLEPIALDVDALNGDEWIKGRFHYER